MLFLKIRIAILLLLSKIFSKVLFVNIPPVVSVAAFIEDDGKMLFLKLSYLDGYGLPGGLVEVGESAEEAIHREIKEETGLEVVECKYLWSQGSFTFGKTLPSLSFYYKVKVTGVLKESREGSLHYLNPHEIIQHLAYTNAKEALKKYTKEKAN